MTFHFARQQADGRLSSPLPGVYPTEKAAMDASTDALRHVRVNQGGTIVLVQVVKEIVPTFKTEFRDPKTMKEFTGKP